MEPALPIITSNSVSSLEVIVENALTYLYPQIKEPQIMDVLLPFEFVKVYINIKKYLRGNRRLLKTEEGLMPKFRITKEKLDISTIGRNGEGSKPKMIEDLSTTIGHFEKCKTSVLDTENQMLGDREVLPNSGKVIRFPRYLTLLPKTEKQTHVMTLIGEVVYIVRPLAYLFLLRIHGTHSYKAYLLNLLIDLGWLACHLLVFRRNLFHKREIRRRIIAAFINYMLRNPFLDDILKEKIIFRILGAIIRSESLKSLIIKLLEFRSSLSYTL